ncbi:MAG: hypothetical protein AAGG48_31005 [Planctomycetota bacterium]
MRFRLATLLIAVFFAGLGFPMLRDWLEKRQLALSDFTSERLADELDAGRPVLVSIFARWDSILDDQLRRMSDDVARKIRDRDVAVLRADWTEKSGDVDQLMTRLGLGTVPAFAIFLPDNRMNPMILRDLTTEAELIAILDSLP